MFLIINSPIPLIMGIATIKSGARFGILNAKALVLKALVLNQMFTTKKYRRIKDQTDQNNET